MVVFDLETVPDLTLGRALVDLLPNAADLEVREKLGERYAREGQDPKLAFIKAPLQNCLYWGTVC